MATRKPEKKKFTFDPSKSYSWEPDADFIIKGIEVDKINRALSAAASTPEFQRNAVLYEGLKAFNNFFKEAVEDGLIVEQAPEEEKPEEIVNGEQEIITPE